MTQPEEVDSVPMRGTVKRGIQMILEDFNRQHSEYLIMAAHEAGLDPGTWKPNMQTFTFDKVKE